MLMDDMQQRSQQLAQEASRAKATIQMLTEQLEQAKVHALTVNGHINELNYHIQLATEAQSKEQADGETQHEEQGQAA